MSQIWTVTRLRVGGGERPSRPWRAIDAATVFFDTRPARGDEVLPHPRRPVSARRPTRVVERRAHRGVELPTSLLTRGGFAVVPLVEPRLRHAQPPAALRVGHTMIGPLGGDERRHAHRVASLTHRTTDRLRTSRSIRSSAFSRSSCCSRARSSTVSPSFSPRSTRSLFTQFPSVPSWT